MPKPISLPMLFEERSVIAINISPLIIRREKSNGIVKQNIINLIKYIMENTTYGIAFIPHVIMPMDNDYDILLEIYNYCCSEYSKERFFMAPYKLSAAEYKYLIAHCRFGVFARTHAAIAAYSSGIPCVTIGYSVKAQGIGNDMGMGDYGDSHLNDWNHSYYTICYFTI